MEVTDKIEELVKWANETQEWRDELEADVLAWVRTKWGLEKADEITKMLAQRHKGKNISVDNPKDA